MCPIVWPFASHLSLWGLEVKSARWGISHDAVDTEQR